MKLVNPSFQILESQGFLKDIELAGRTCYKSEDKITENSASKFVRMLENSRHGAALEHGTIYLKLSIGSPVYDLDYLENMDVMLFYKGNPYSVVNEEIDSHGFVKTYYITTNYRVIFENNRQYDLKFQCEPTKLHEKRVSVKLVVSRAIQNELVRHRSMSFMVESTRFCNYSKDKFGGELTFIKSNITEDEHTRFLLEKIEETYLSLIEEGYKPQEARDILPLNLKTEMVITGTIKDWEALFKLRTAEDAHPEVRELMLKVKASFDIYNS